MKKGVVAKVLVACGITMGAVGVSAIPAQAITQYSCSSSTTGYFRYEYINSGTGNSWECFKGTGTNNATWRIKEWANYKHGGWFVGNGTVNYFTSSSVGQDYASVVTVTQTELSS